MITAKWANPEKTIIQVDYYTPVESWEEYHKANDQALEMIKGVEHPVYVVHNPGRVVMPPGSPITHLRKAIIRFQQIHNCAAVIAVIENVFALNMVSVVAKVLLPGKFRLAKTLEVAYASIPVPDSAVA